jgi:tetratricopeptide (TPR) repeat protein
MMKRTPQMSAKTVKQVMSNFTINKNHKTMKRLYSIVLGAALLAAPALHAQNFGGIPLAYEKISVDKLKKEIEKSDAEIADPKKSAKAATWVKRGEVLLDMDGKPVNGLFVGLDEPTFKLSFGEAPTETVDLGGVQYTVYTYEHFKGYVSGGKLAFYIPTTIITDNAIGKAYDAFAKAYDMDAKTVKKVNLGMLNIQNRSLEKGSAYFNLQDYKAAADNFRMAYKASIHPSINMPDTMSLYNAGFVGTLAGEYTTALEDLDGAISLGYENNGDAYYYKFYCLYQLDRKDEATKTLEEAIGKYPNNDSIIAALLDIYSTEPDKDPTNLIPLVLNVIEQNPTNADLYVGLARVYDKLNQRDNAIEAARTAVTIAPDHFFGNYFLGLFFAKKGDDEDIKFRDATITSREQYQKDLAAVNAIYAEAIAPLEKAYEINPAEPSTVELLKNLTFRLRDAEGMTPKYEKYNELYKAIQSE